MPQKEAYENRILAKKEGKRNVHGGVANLIQLTMGQANEFLERRGLSCVDVFAANQHPRKPITTFQAPSVDRLGEHLHLPFGNSTLPS